MLAVPWSMNAHPVITLLGSPAMVVMYCLCAKLLGHINL